MRCMPCAITYEHCCLAPNVAAAAALFRCLPHAGEFLRYIFGLQKYIFFKVLLFLNLLLYVLHICFSLLLSQLALLLLCFAADSVYLWPSRYFLQSLFHFADGQWSNVTLCMYVCVFVVCCRCWRWVLLLSSIFKPHASHILPNELRQTSIHTYVHTYICIYMNYVHKYRYLHIYMHVWLCVCVCCGFIGMQAAISFVSNQQRVYYQRTNQPASQPNVAYLFYY